MKKIVALMLSLVLVIGLLAGCGGSTPSTTAAPGTTAAPSGEGYTLRLGHVCQTTHPFHIGSEKFKKLVEEKSNGRITIELYPARALGDDASLLEQVMGNTLEIGLVSGPVFSAYTPVIDSLQLPFMLNTYDKEKAAYKTAEFQALMDSLNKLDMQGLAVFEGGMRYMANAIRPVEKPEDLNGLKLRTTASDLVMDVVKALGGNPNPMAYGEVYSALQSKVIDGEEINLTSIYSEKHYEVLKYVSKVALFPFPGILVMNTKRLASLPEADQKLLQECATEAMFALLDEMPSIDDTAVANIKDKVEIKDVDAKPFMDKCKDLYDVYAAKDAVIANFLKMAQGLQ